jgi:hypothetical protein
MLRPPGCSNTSRSGWRQQENDSCLIAVALEHRLQRSHAAQITQRRVRVRRLRARACQRAKHTRHRDERHPSTTANSRQFPGFRGTAVVESAGHGALTAVKHMFPEKLLLLPGAD